MIYDYRKNITTDIIDYIEENYEKDEILDLTYDDLYDDLFISDSITGNASGSYTCNTWTAAEFLIHNEDLLLEALDEFGGDYRKAIESPEYADVTIRCYLLSECLTEALDELQD